MITNEIYRNRPSILTPYLTPPSSYVRRHVYLYRLSTASWSQINAFKHAKECVAFVTSMLQYLCGGVPVDTLPYGITPTVSMGNTQNARSEVLRRPPNYLYVYLHYCRKERVLYIWSHLLIHTFLESCSAA